MRREETSIGILGVGQYLPPTVRDNGWWPASFAEKILAKRSADIMNPEAFAAKAQTPLQKMQLQEMFASHGDPFRGTQERRVLEPERPTCDMEAKAAEEALARAGIDAGELGLIIVSSNPSDCFNPSNAGEVQHRIGAKRANAVSLETGCSSFLNGLAVADAMVRARQCRYALVVASATFSRLLDYDDPASVIFGDGAGAAVVGPVPSGLGFQGHILRCDGSLNHAVCIGPKSDARWYDGSAPLRVHSKHPDMGRVMVMSTADAAADVVGQVLEEARIGRDEVTHFYSHQAVCWFNRVCRRATGFEHAKTFDTFERYASMGAANIPVNLRHAEEAGQLKQGDTVVLYATGAGFTWGATVLRWSTSLTR